MILRIILLVVAYLLLGAHFLRSGSLGWMALCFSIPFLLLIRKRWSLIIVQISLYIGSWIWVRTGIIIIHERMMLGIPWIRVALIIGLLALFTLLAGLLLNAPVMKARYPRKNENMNQD